MAEDVRRLVVRTRSSRAAPARLGRIRAYASCTTTPGDCAPRAAKAVST